MIWSKGYAMPVAATADQEYQTALNAFKDSVLALKDLHGFRFDQAYEITEERRVAVEKAKRAVEHHQREHRCS
jgi:hypothetical protein